MAVTAEELIDDAKLQLSSLASVQRVREAVLMKTLSRLDEEVVQLTSRTAPDLLSTKKADASFTDSGNKNGYTLQDGVHYRDFIYVEDDDETTPITLVMKKDQDYPGMHPAGFLQISKSRSGAQFFPVDPLGERWAGNATRDWFEPGEGDTMSYSYVPPGGGLSKLSDELQSPEMARQFLVQSLILSGLTSQPGVSGDRLSLANQQMSQARKDLMVQLHKFAHSIDARPRNEQRLRLRDDDLRELY